MGVKPHVQDEAAEIGTFHASRPMSEGFHADLSGAENLIKRAAHRSFFIRGHAASRGIVTLYVDFHHVVAFERGRSELVVQSRQQFRIVLPARVLFLIAPERLADIIPKRPVDEIADLS